MTAAPAVALEVLSADVGTRLDVLLVRRLDGVSRTDARRLIEDGAVRLNGRLARKGTRLAEGDKVELERVPEAKEFDPAPSPELPLAVLHEDAWLVAVDKPAGAPTHPLREGERDTLVNALVARYPEMLRVGYARREPGILHRLDNDTSGVLLAARSHEAFDALRGMLQRGEMDKRYLALVEGRYGGPPDVTTPVGRHPSDDRRALADRDAVGARPAVTEIVAATTAGDHTLLELRASVAVRHQIRAHLASLGHPLVGDVLYGGPDAGLGRHFLHASSIALRHPFTGDALRVEAPLPAELRALL